MAIVYWTGNAEVVAQINVAQPAITAFDATTRYGVTINGKTVDVLGDTDIATTLVALSSALNNSAIPEFRETIASNDGIDELTLTSSLPGKPFVAVMVATGGTGTVGTFTVTKGSGPNDVGVDANWSSGAIPQSADDVRIQNSSVGLLYGLSDFDAVAFQAIRVYQDFTGQIGLPRNSALGYEEYRTTHFESLTLDIRLGIGLGSGSGRIQFDCKGTAAAIIIENTGNAASQSLAPVQLIGILGGTITADSGRVGIAQLAGEFAEVDLMIINQCQVVAGVDALIGDVDVNGSGGLEWRNRRVVTAPDVTIRNGNSRYIESVGVLGLVDVQGGTFNYEAPADITDLKVVGTMNFSDLSAPILVTNKAIFFSGASVRDPNGMVTFTAGWETSGCKLSEVNLDFGQGRTYSIL